MPNLTKNHTEILSTIEQAKTHSSSEQAVTLLAVSKQKPASMVRDLFTTGQCDFGENYLQEALEKMTELAELPLIWHYIGHIQRNKTRDIATHFTWVHTLERDIIARRLSEQRPSNLPPLNVCIQVNIDDESSKSGVHPSEVLALAKYAQNLDNLRLRGLMVIPSKAGGDAFARTKQLFDEAALKLNSPDWDTLSMGMSSDFGEAIAHGATIVRVGSKLFGARS